ncbi:MAG: hypothetical protein U0892_18560 [Pirellulales bacterium]
MSVALTISAQHGQAPGELPGRHVQCGSSSAVNLTDNTISLTGNHGLRSGYRLSTQPTMNRTMACATTPESGGFAIDDSSLLAVLRLLPTSSATANTAEDFAEGHAEFRGKAT